MARGYEEMSASEVIADLHGEGYKDPDTGEVWDGEGFVSPGASYGYVETVEVDRAKQAAKAEYLQTFRNLVVSRERDVADAEDRLRRALADLSAAEANANRWYGRGV